MSPKSFILFLTELEPNSYPPENGENLVTYFSEMEIQWT